MPRQRARRSATLRGFAFRAGTYEQSGVPGLSGATLRVFYSFMPATFCGRLWTT